MQSVKKQRSNQFRANISPLHKTIKYLCFLGDFYMSKAKEKKEVTTNQGKKHLFGSSEKSDFILNMSAESAQKLCGVYSIIAVLVLCVSPFSGARQTLHLRHAIHRRQFHQHIAPLHNDTDYRANRPARLSPLKLRITIIYKSV